MLDDQHRIVLLDLGVSEPSTPTGRMGFVFLEHLGGGYAGDGGAVVNSTLVLGI